MRKNAKNVGIALVGCGTVGGAVAVMLTRDRELLERRTGLSLELKYIVDKNFRNAEKLGLDKSLYETSLDKALEDPEVAVAVELVGGITFAKTVTEKAIAAGKHVVTANKALIAHAGAELLSLARKKGVTVSFEASCGGGIPIIRALYDGLIANRIDALYGIVNGTCNYILTQMTQMGWSYEEALAGAQKDGLAEADPTLDVSGMDSAHKITILASLAFGRHIELEDIPVSGINTLKSMDVAFGSQLGYVVKLLAVANRLNGGVCLRVRPAFISRQHPLAWVSGPFNAISVYGHATGHTMHYGRGAGGSPTASAICADIVSAGLGNMSKIYDALGIWTDRTPKAKIVPTDELTSRYYLRFLVNDTVGVLAKIAAALGKQGISIASVLQQESLQTSSDEPVIPVVIVTHAAKEKSVRKALAAIVKLDFVIEEPVCINIVEEHEEQF